MSNLAAPSEGQPTTLASSAPRAAEIGYGSDCGYGAMGTRPAQDCGLYPNEVSVA